MQPASAWLKKKDGALWRQIFVVGYRRNIKSFGLRKVPPRLFLCISGRVSFPENFVHALFPPECTCGQVSLVGKLKEVSLCCFPQHEIEHNWHAWSTEFTDLGQPVSLPWSVHALL